MKKFLVCVCILLTFVFMIVSCSEESSDKSKETTKVESTTDGTENSNNDTSSTEENGDGNDEDTPPSTNQSSDNTENSTDVSTNGNGGTDVSTEENGGTDVSTDENGGADVSTDGNGGTDVSTDENGGTDVSTDGNGGTDVSTDDQEGEDEEENIPDGPIDIAVGYETDYVVVYDDSDLGTVEFAEKFIEYMKNTHKITFPSVKASDKLTIDHAIYIGDVKGTSKVKDRMENVDFGACVSGNDYVFYATNSRLYEYLYDIVTTETLIGIRSGNWSTQPKKDFIYHKSSHSETTYIEYVLNNNGGTLTYEIMLKFFVPRTFTAEDGTVMQYRIYVPYEYTDIEALPVLTILHGAGERGNDNVSQMKNMIFNLFKNEENPVWDSIVVCPQCPSWPNQWVDTPWGDGDYDISTVPESNEAKAVMEIIDFVKGSYPTDENRYYIAGLSMGGFGTWDLLMRHTEVFAAAIPICGGGDHRMAEKLLNKPIYTFHGTADTSVPVSGTKAMVDAILDLGGTKLQYKYFVNAGHIIWNDVAAMTDVWNWLFDQSLENQ